MGAAVPVSSAQPHSSYRRVFLFPVGEGSSRLPGSRWWRRHSSRLCLDLIPGSLLNVCKNAAHGLYLSHRDRLNTELLDFVKS
jgi:hypothetical protein